MRLATVLCLLLFCGVAAFGQVMVSRGAAISYGYGPYVPLVTTPSVSLQSASPNAVGATNATGGLTAGATNATLSIVPVNTDAVYTRAVWYSGGDAPITSPTISLRRTSAARVPATTEPQQEELLGWTFFGSPAVNSPVEASAKAKAGPRATKTYTNDDISRLKDVPLSQK